MTSECQFKVNLNFNKFRYLTGPGKTFMAFMDEGKILAIQTGRYQIQLFNVLTLQRNFERVLNQAKEQE